MKFSNEKVKHNDEPQKREIEQYKKPEQKQTQLGLIEH